MSKYQKKKIAMEEYALEYLKHEELCTNSFKDNRYKRLVAYQQLARALQITPWYARALERQFRKFFVSKMQALVRHGLTDISEMPKEPSWLKLVEAKLNTLPTLLQDLNCRRRLSRAAPDEVVSALCTQAQLRGALCARDSYVLVARTLRLAVPVNDLHAAWVAAQRVSMRFLALSCRSGDDPQTSLSLSHAQVADAVLLQTDVNAHRLVTDESDLIAPEATSLAFLWRLVQRHRLEERAPLRSRVRAQRWTRAYHHYLASDRLASLVVLQRRWYEMKLRARVRLLARYRARFRNTVTAITEAAPPTKMDIDIVRKFPHIITSPLPSWRRLVRQGIIVTQLLSDDESDQEEELPSRKRRVPQMTKPDAKQDTKPKANIATPIISETKCSPAKTAILAPKTTLEKTITGGTNASSEKAIILGTKPIPGNVIILGTKASSDSQIIASNKTSPEKIILESKPGPEKTIILAPKASPVKQPSAENTIISIQQSNPENTIISIPQPSLENTIISVPQPSPENTIISIPQPSPENTIISVPQLSPENTIISVPETLSEAKSEVLTDQDDVIIKESHSSNIPCRTKREPIKSENSDMKDFLDDPLKPAIEEMLNTIDPSKVKTEIFIESDPEMEHSENLQNGDSKDIIKTQLPIKAEIFIKEEPSVSMASRIVFDSDEDDDMSYDVSGDVSQESDTESSEAAFDAQLLMQTKIKLTRVHDLPEWQEHAIDDKYIDVNYIKTSDVIETKDTNRIKLEKDSDIEIELQTDCVIELDSEDDIPPKIPRLATPPPADSRANKLELEVLVKQKLQEAHAKNKHKQKPPPEPEELATPATQDVLPITELQVLLEELSLTADREQTVSIRYCCPARQHAVQCDIQRGDGLPPLPPHTHEDGPCACCCKELCEQRGSATAQVELLALHHDIIALLKKSAQRKAQKSGQTRRPGPKRPKKKKDTKNNKDSEKPTEGTISPAAATMDESKKPDANTEIGATKTDSTNQDKTNAFKEAETTTPTKDGLDEWIRQKNLNKQFFQLPGLNEKPKTSVPGPSVTPIWNVNNTSQDSRVVVFVGGKPTIVNLPNTNKTQAKTMNVAQMNNNTTVKPLNQPEIRNATEDQVICLSDEEGASQKGAPTNLPCPPMGVPPPQMPLFCPIGVPPPQMPPCPPMGVPPPQMPPCPPMGVPPPQMPRCPPMGVPPPQMPLCPPMGVQPPQIPPCPPMGVPPPQMPPCAPMGVPPPQMPPCPPMWVPPPQIPRYPPTGMPTQQISVENRNIVNVSTVNTNLQPRIIPQQKFIPTMINLRTQPRNSFTANQNRLMSPTGSPLGLCPKPAPGTSVRLVPQDGFITQPSKVNNMQANFQRMTLPPPVSMATNPLPRNIVPAPRIPASATEGWYILPIPNPNPTYRMPIYSIPPPTIKQMELTKPNNEISSSDPVGFVTVQPKGTENGHNSNTDALSVSSLEPRTDQTITASSSTSQAPIPPNKSITIISCVTLKGNDLTQGDISSLSKFGVQSNGRKKALSPPKGVVEVDKLALNKIIIPKVKASRSSMTTNIANTSSYNTENTVSSEDGQYERDYGEWVRQKNINKQFFEPPGSRTPDADRKMRKGTLKKKLFKRKEKRCKQNKHGKDKSTVENEVIISDSSMKSIISIPGTSQNGSVEGEYVESNELVQSEIFLNDETANQESLIQNKIPESLEINELSSPKATIHDQAPLDNMDTNSIMLINDHSSTSTEVPEGEIISFRINDKKVQNEIILHDAEGNCRVITQCEINDLQVSSDENVLPVEAEIPTYIAANFNEIPVHSENISSEAPSTNQEISDEIPPQNMACRKTSVCDQTDHNDTLEFSSSSAASEIPPDTPPVPTNSVTETSLMNECEQTEIPQESTDLGKHLAYTPDINNKSPLTNFTNNNYLTHSNNNEHKLTGITDTNQTLNIDVPASDAPLGVLEDYLGDEDSTPEPLYIEIPNETAVRAFAECFITPDSPNQKPQSNNHILNNPSPFNNYIPTLIVGEYPKEKSNETSPQSLKQHKHAQNFNFVQKPREYNLDQSIHKIIDRNSMRSRNNRNFSNILSPERLYKTHIDVQIVGEYPSKKKRGQSLKNSVLQENEVTLGKEHEVNLRRVKSEQKHEIPVELKSIPHVEFWGDYPSADKREDKDKLLVIHNDVNTPKDSPEDTETTSSVNPDDPEKCIVGDDGSDGDENLSPNIVSSSENINQKESTDIQSPKGIDATDSTTKDSDDLNLPHYELVPPKENNTCGSQSTKNGNNEEDHDFTKPPIRLVLRRVADGIRKCSMYMVPSSSPGKNNIISLPQDNAKAASSVIDPTSVENLGLDTDPLDPVRLIVPPTEPVTFKLDLPTKRKRSISGLYGKNVSVSNQSEHIETSGRQYQEVPVIPDEVIAEVLKSKSKPKVNNIKEPAVVVGHKCKEQKVHSFLKLPPEVLDEKLVTKEKLRKEISTSLNPKPIVKQSEKSEPNIEHPFSELPSPPISTKLNPIDDDTLEQPAKLRRRKRCRRISSTEDTPQIPEQIETLKTNLDNVQNTNRFQHTQINSTVVVPQDIIKKTKKTKARKHKRKSSVAKKARAKTSTKNKKVIEDCHDIDSNTNINTEISPTAIEECPVENESKEQDTTPSVVQRQELITTEEPNTNLPYKDLPIRKRPYARQTYEIEDDSNSLTDTCNSTAEHTTNPGQFQSEADKEYELSSKAVMHFKTLNQTSNESSPIKKKLPEIKVSLPLWSLLTENILKLIRLKNPHISVPSNEYNLIKQRLMPDISKLCKPDYTICEDPLLTNALNGTQSEQNSTNDTTSSILQEDYATESQVNSEDESVTEKFTEPVRSLSFYISAVRKKYKIETIQCSSPNKVMRYIRLKLRSEREHILKRSASCTQLRSLDPVETLTGSTDIRNMGKIGNTLTRYGSIDGTLEWYQEIKYLVESPDIKEIAFKVLNKPGVNDYEENTTAIHDNLSDSDTSVSIDEIPLPEVEPCITEIPLSEIPLPADLPPVEMVLTSWTPFQDSDTIASNIPNIEMDSVAKAILKSPPPPPPREPSP